MEISFVFSAFTTDEGRYVYDCTEFQDGQSVPYGVPRYFDNAEARDAALDREIARRASMLGKSVGQAEIDGNISVASL